jgi:FO synthase
VPSRGDPSQLHRATYLEICRAVKAAAPEIHVHAFSPLEVVHGATTLGLSLETFLEQLRDAGLGSLPGTAAEILDDEVRKIICPDKIDVATWTDVISTAHQVGLKTTSTMMFGSVESYSHWARHMLKIRDIQSRTGGITEFVPLPFIADESPMYKKGRARMGPTYREAILVHAVARIVFHHFIPNIQASWVKLGKDGVSDCLAAGANDLGGTLMNESISRAAGAQHGQELPPAMMHAWIESAGRKAAQRTTTYGVATNERMTVANCAGALSPIVLTPPKRRSYQIVEESAHV